MELCMTSTQTTNNHALVLFEQEEVKSSLDRAWAKVQESNNLWIEGTLELINILHYARERFGSDQDFGKWLTAKGYSEDRLPRHHRQALLNMALDLEVTREVLAQTERRSWRYIWELEIQPKLEEAQLPYVGQPADSTTPEEASANGPERPGESESPVAIPTNNLEQPAGDEKPDPNPANNLEQQQPSNPTKKLTRRPRRGNGAKKPMTEWGKDLNHFMSDGLLIANALIRIKQAIAGSPPDKQAEMLGKVTEVWSDQMDRGCDAAAWIRDWAYRGLDEKADKDIKEGRVLITPAQASKQVQPEEA
jgi:hypothetical protein